MCGIDSIFFYMNQAGMVQKVWIKQGEYSTV